MKQFINALPPGSVLHGKVYTYTIEEALGQGSFGITYLATTQVQMQGPLGSITTTQKVAVKEFFMKEINGRDDSTVTSGSKGDGLFERYRKKFVTEAKNLAKLNHPNIIKVLEAFEDNNTVYYAMEYIDGGSLDDLTERERGLSEKETLRFTRQIASALEYMHRNKMLHLDLKPGNIMLKGGNAVLIDFGLSKQYDEKGEPESSTTVGGGTPGYAPLEQASYHEGHGFPVTMDVYALGGTMLKMLTGLRPPEASEMLNEGFPKERLRHQGVSEALIAVIEKAMAPMRKDRYQTVSEMVDALSGIEEGTEIDKPCPQKEVHVTPDPEPAPVADPDSDPKPKSNLKYIAAAIAVALIVGLGAYFIAGGSSTPTTTEAAAQEDSTEQKEKTVSDFKYSTENNTYYWTGPVTDDGIPDGEGVARFTDGREYHGTMQRGMMVSDKASFKFKNGDSFEGSFTNDHFSSGVYTVAEDGSYFKGDFDSQGQPSVGTWYDKSGTALQTMGNLNSATPSKVSEHSS